MFYINLIIFISVIIFNVLSDNSTELNSNVTRTIRSPQQYYQGNRRTGHYNVASVNNGRRSSSGGGSGITNSRVRPKPRTRTRTRTRTTNTRRSNSAGGGSRSVGFKTDFEPEYNIAPEYQPGYQQGYQPGYQQGYQQGYQPGYQQAYQQGYQPQYQQQQQQQQPGYGQGYQNNFGVAGVGCEVPKAGDHKRGGHRRGGRRGGGRWRDGGGFDRDGSWEEYTDKQKRKSEIKYEEYWRRIYECGNADENEPLTSQDLNGRLVAVPGEYRHMAVIGIRGSDRKKEWKCGGSLIDFNFVLTAAHCTTFGGQAATHVKIGDINLKVREDTVATQRMRIEQIIRHPLYRKNSYYHDIALLRLSKPAVWTRHVRPVRLWAYGDFPINTVYALGYGATQFGRTPIEVLTFLNLTMINHQQCSAALPPNPDAKKGIIESQLCALDLEGKKDTCQGDSGGPLQLHLPGRRKTKYYLVGITSYGLACGSRAPSVYTRIYSYLDWIESVVWPY